MVDLHWTPQQFWQASVPEFWAAVDLLAERNLDQEEELDEIRRSSSRPGYRGMGPSQPYKGDDRAERRWSGSLEDAINPNMRLRPRPDWGTWREELRANTGI